MGQREFFDRYGPALVVVAALTLLVAVLPGNVKRATDLSSTDGPAAALDGSTGTGDAGSQDAAATGSTGGPASGPGATGATGGPGGTGTGAPAGVRFGTGAHCTPDSRQIGFSIYNPPCADWTRGSPNGGRTARGVTGDRILVIDYRNRQAAATGTALQAAGASDTPEDIARMREALRTYFNNHYETYGREVVIEAMDATGEDSNEVAMRSDAITIAETKGAFAAFTEGFGPPVLARELAQRGVICICTQSDSTTLYNSVPPYIFSNEPTSEEYYAHTAEYAGKRLARRKAAHAGSAALTTADRRFGFIWVEGQEGAPSPGAKSARDFFLRELARYGVRPAAEFAYTVDFAGAGEMAASAIARMIDADVTTILMNVDPLFPVFLTREATRQQFFPEWVVSAQALVGTTFLGRTYDQVQWAHAFGISPIAVLPTDFSKAPAYRAYHHARPQDSDGDEGISIAVMYNEMDLLWRGIHMAGPRLTPEAFAQGMFRYPRTGGVPTAALHYHTRPHPTAVKDFTEVWWDVDRRAPDEIGNDGIGVMMRADGGRRYALGQWPTSPANVFNEAGSVIGAPDAPGGPAYWNHAADGHVHTTRCLSCTR